MKTLISVILNGLFLFAIIFVALVITIYSLDKKETLAQASGVISGSVVKTVIPVMATQSGVLNNIHVKVGDLVKKDDAVASLTIPGKGGNASVLPLLSPVNGVAFELMEKTTLPVEEGTAVIKMYSNEDIGFSASLSDEEYQEVIKQKNILVHSVRLDQGFTVIPSILQPEVRNNSVGQPRIEMLFKFQNMKEAASLLNGEQLTIQLPSSTSKPSIVKRLEQLVTRYKIKP